MRKFNVEHELRNIEHHPFLRNHRVLQRAPWIGHMFTVHVLDHPTRSTLDQGGSLRLANPYPG